MDYADCGIFGSCNIKSEENAENIVRLSDFASQIAEIVYALAENLDEKFFTVTSDFVSIKTGIRRNDTNPKLGGNSKALRNFQTQFSQSSRLINFC